MSKRQFSMVSPLIWRSERFHALSCQSQVLHLYFMTCEHQNSSGCFRLPEGYACSDLGWDLADYRTARQELVQSGLISYDDATHAVFVESWFKHCPPMNDKHASGTRRLIEEIECDELRERVSEQFEEVDHIRRGKRFDPIGVSGRLANSSLMRRAG